MVGLVELVFAEDNKTLVRRDNHQVVSAKPIGEPGSIGTFKHLISDTEVMEIVESQIVSHGRSKGADAYVRGDSHVKEKIWRVDCSGGSKYYWLPVQYYKLD